MSDQRADDDSSGRSTSSALVGAPDAGAAELARIRAYHAQFFYEDGEIVHSFRTALKDRVDCIDYHAQHSVKAAASMGINVDVVPPPLPPALAGVRPANTPAGLAFDGVLDADGNARACPSGTVPATRPSIDEIETAGGLDAYQWKMAQRPRPNGSQSTYQHDCWSNCSGPGNSPGGVNAQYEHVVGLQSYSAYGMLSFLSVHNPSVVNTNEHSVSQIWAQTGACDNFPEYGMPHTCVPGGSGANAAVESLEAGWIVYSGDPQPRLFAFFTSDAYWTRYCFAGQGNCCTPTGDGGVGQQSSSCWVALQGASYVANQALPYNGPGSLPVEIAVQVYQGSLLGAQYSGWWVYVNGNAIGWYPPNTFYNGATAGPMAYGPSTYQQVGGEVYDTWPGMHTETQMGSGYAPPAFGSTFSAYHRNIQYITSSNTYATLPLNFYYAPTCEGNGSVPGMCEFGMGSWGTPHQAGCGAYSLSQTGSPSGQNWGSYFLYGGGPGNAAGGAGYCQF